MPPKFQKLEKSIEKQIETEKVISKKNKRLAKNLSIKQLNSLVDLAKKASANYERALAQQIKFRKIQQTKQDSLLYRIQQRYRSLLGYSKTTVLPPINPRETELLKLFETSEQNVLYLEQLQKEKEDVQPQEPEAVTAPSTATLPEPIITVTQLEAATQLETVVAPSAKVITTVSTPTTALTNRIVATPQLAVAPAPAPQLETETISTSDIVLHPPKETKTNKQLQRQKKQKRNKEVQLARQRREEAKKQREQERAERQQREQERNSMLQEDSGSYQFRERLKREKKVLIETEMRREIEETKEKNPESAYISVQSKYCSSVSLIPLKEVFHNCLSLSEQKKYGLCTKLFFSRLSKRPNDSEIILNEIAETISSVEPSKFYR